MVTFAKIGKGGEKVELDSAVGYPGGAGIADESLKNVRRALGLPLTKQLVHYADIRSADSAEKVESFRIVEMFDDWYTLELQIEGKADAVRMHNAFFAEMQKASFVADMRRSAARMDAA